MKTMIRILCVVVAVGAISVTAHADITIGVNLSTTGPGASMGIGMKNALQMGPSVIAGQKVNYVILDDGSDTTTAVQNVKRLISQEKIDVLLGPGNTPTTLAALPVIAESKVPSISFGSASVIVYPVDAKRKWVFKTIANDDVFAEMMVNHMVKKHVKKIAVIATDDPYGESWVDVTKKCAAKVGIHVSRVEKYQRNDTSTTSQVLRMMKESPDAILVAAAGTPSTTPHRGLTERGYKGLIYQTGGAANPEFLRVGGKAVEGGYVLQSPFIVAEQLPDGYPTKKAAVEFLKKYESKFGPRSAFAPFAWDALKLLESAIPVALKKAKPGTPQFRAALRDALESSKGVVGSSAVYTMSPTDHSGINQLGMSVIKIANGQWKLEAHADYK